MNSKRLGKVLVFTILIAGIAGNVGLVRAQTAGPSFDVSFNPGGGQTIGNSVNIHIKVNSGNPGATRIRVSCGGVSKGETSEVEFDSTWHTDGCSAGTQQITIQARNPDDPNWSAANTQTFNYSLTGGDQPQQPTQTSQPQEPSRGPDISTLDLSPSGGANVGDQVDIHIRVDSGNPGATKINVSCGTISKVETSEVDFHSTWYTNGCPGGEARVDVYSRAVNDPNWTNPSSASKNYNLSAPPSYNAPTANLWVDAGSIQSGQCTYLHWTTSDADNVSIDGNGVETSGDKQICPTVTTRYTLTAKGPGGTAERNVTVVVTSQPAQSSVASSFNTGDVINIGGNIHVIVNGERRLVPNPETLDALGISRSMINNRGFSDAELNTIPRGQDIPDVNRDPSGFQAFKNQIFPNNTPIVTSQPAVQVPPTVMPTQPTGGGTTGGQETLTPTVTPTIESNLLPPADSCQGSNLSWLDKFLGITSVDASCTDYVYKSTTAIEKCWGENVWPNAGLWDDWARDPNRSGSCGWSVEAADTNGVNNSKPGDIVVWNGYDQNNGQSCAGAGSVGHVALFVNSNNDGTIHVNGANWSDDQSRTRVDSRCMSIIHLNLQASPSNEPADKCSKYQWYDPRNWFCHLGWIN